MAEIPWWRFSHQVSGSHPKTNFYNFFTNSNNHKVLINDVSCVENFYETMVMLICEASNNVPIASDITFMNKNRTKKEKKLYLLISLLNLWGRNWNNIWQSISGQFPIILLFLCLQFIRGSLYLHMLCFYYKFTLNLFYTISFSQLDCIDIGMRRMTISALFYSLLYSIWA